MNAHPAAAIFPLLEGEEFDRLVADISEKGQLEPAVVLEGQILDGRNRARACAKLGIDVETREWDGRPEGSPTGYVLSVNLYRRHLTTGQKAMAAAEAAPLFESEARERQRQGGRTAGRGRPLEKVVPVSAPAMGKTREKAAAAVGGLSHSYFSIAKDLRANHPDIAAKVRRGEMTIPAAAKAIKRHESIGGSVAKTAKRKLTGDDRGEKLAGLLLPLDRYLEQWDEENVYGITRARARKLLDQVQRVHRRLVDVSIAVEARTVESRALK